MDIEPTTTFQNIFHASVAPLQNSAEIAEKIGEVLRQAGLQTDVLPAARVKDLTPYQAVVLGSAVYIGKWRKEAAKFLQANEKMLAERQVHESYRGYELFSKSRPNIQRLRLDDREKAWEEMGNDEKLTTSILAQINNRLAGTGKEESQ